MKKIVYSFKYIFIFFCVAGYTSSQELLTEDPFYKKTLPNLMGEKFVQKGTYRSAYYARINSLHPFSENPFVSSLWFLCTGSLAQIHTGLYQTMAPCLARQIVKKKVPRGTDYYVELQKGVFWDPVDPKLVKIPNLAACFQKKVPLIANDFKLYIDLIKNPYLEMPLAVSLRSHYQNLESIEVLDDQHFIIHWTGEEEVKQDALTAQLKPLPEHVFLYNSKGQVFLDDSKSDLLSARYFENHWAKKTIVSCGPWKLFAVKNDCIELERNASYPESYRALFQKMSFIYKSSQVNAWQSFKGDQLDSYYLPPSQWNDYQNFIQSKFYSKQVELGNSIEKEEFLSKMYYFIGWNQKNLLFKDQKVRLALTYAIDSQLIIDHFLKGLGTPLTGPFIPGGSSYNQTLKLHRADYEKAKLLLEEAGWHLGDAEGIRTHYETHQPLRFYLSYFVQNELAQSICQFISTSLREVGVDCVLDGLDYAGFMEKYQTKDFDALYMAWSLGTPPEDLAQTWSSDEANKRGSSNLIGFKNEEVDALIHQLKICKNKKERQKSYYRIHEIIYQEQPYTFLYVPKQIFLYRCRLKNVFIPSERRDLISNADIQEICPRIFYFGEE
ncbi:MAG: hypothetical protein S4CHLAM7_09730 [Chlamydiae bacterium]|nr:hypothetical protein [Chlamydiota bacterium]